MINNLLFTMGRHYLLRYYDKKVMKNALLYLLFKCRYNKYNTLDAPSYLNIYYGRLMNFNLALNHISNKGKYIDALQEKELNFRELRR